jgi:catechol 2,3-dioxygenase-like lactoylglutathione lyase family enzyme
MTLLASAHPVSFVLTSDRSKTKPFYAGALGLPVLSDDPFAVTFALAGGATMRLTDLPGHRALDHTVLGWTVPDIRAAVAELAARGIMFKLYEGFGQDELGIWSAPGGGAQVAWFTDPDGNVLSITQFGE